MAGLVQSQAASQISDPMLQKIIAGVRAKTPADLQVPYLQVLNDGKKFMVSPQTSEVFIQRLHAPGNLVQNVSSGIADLIALLYKESNRKMNVTAAMLASIELMAEALDMAEKTMGIKVNQDIISACEHATSLAVMKRFGIGPVAIQKAVQLGKQNQQVGA